MSNRTAAAEQTLTGSHPPVSLSRNVTSFIPWRSWSGPEAVPVLGPQRHIVPMERSRSTSSLLSLKKVQNLAARLFPHDTARVMCPPGPIPTGPQPPLIVSSLMRSGTHLAIDLLLNNIVGYRQSPLFIDFDTYIYEGFSPEPLMEAGSCVVKTHFVQRPFAAESGAVLRRLADRGVVIIPLRPVEKTRRSMSNWGYQVSEGELRDLHLQHLDFWKAHDPVLVDFEALLDPAKAGAFLAEVRERSGLPAVPAGTVTKVAGSCRRTNLWRKLRTRLQAGGAPHINTSLGFKL